MRFCNDASLKITRKILSHLPPVVNRFYSIFSLLLQFFSLVLAHLRAAKAKRVEICNFPSLKWQKSKGTVPLFLPCNSPCRVIKSSCDEDRRIALSRPCIKRVCPGACERERRCLCLHAKGDPFSLYGERCRPFCSRLPGRAVLLSLSGRAVLLSPSEAKRSCLEFFPKYCKCACACECAREVHESITYHLQLTLAIYYLL